MGVPESPWGGHKEPPFHSTYPGIRGRIEARIPAWASTSAGRYPLVETTERFPISESSLEGRTRSALDLVASLETGAPGAAIAGGWAAIEAILARPDTQNVEAAADLAVLVACSFPRAELTPFTHAYEAEHQDHLADTLRAATSNRDRCTILGSAIERGETLRFSRPSDQAALERIAQIVRDPRGVLIRVAANVEEAIRRLYRQRNLVLHAGITNSVAMDPTLRTVPPLVGAGFDRLVHDALATG